MSVNAAAGTASMSIPLPLSPGRSGFTPALQLTYDSAAGNSVFGFGWGLSTSAITRKTDKGLPRYLDDEESDVFILSGAEDLVPVLDVSGARKMLTRTVWGTAYLIFFYRPRIEGLFARIERWQAVATGISHWRCLSHDNVTSLYGYDEGSRIAAPDDPAKVFAWHLCRSWDDKGDLAVYSYVNEDSADVDGAAAHEANRSPAARAAQTYLTTIQYANLDAYYPDWTAEAEPALPNSWLFSMVLDYGAPGAPLPLPNSKVPWALRPDPFSSYRAGFEIRTYRRAQRLLCFNNFPNESSAGPDLLVRSLDFSYSDQQAPADPHNPIYTLLVSATETGYSRMGDGVVSRSLPPLEFTYSVSQIQNVVQRLDRDSLGNLPEGIDGSRFHWVDLDGEGLSGILSEAMTGWYYKRNVSANNLVAELDGSVSARASFGPVESVATLPSRSELSGAQQLLDLSGSGRLDVVEFVDPDPGYFRRTAEAGFEPHRRFTSLPQLDWGDPNLRFIDLNGDGLADILITEDGLFTCYASLGEAGFDAAEFVRTPWDEEKGPKVVLADGTDTMFLADMSGDGLNDIVRVRNGETCYWPNLGYGRFGAKVTMDRSPRFDNEERFDASRIRLADIDGTGTTDILYVGDDGVQVWFNQSGNSWSVPTNIAVFPTADRFSTVQVMDLLGTGTACLVWSSPLPGESTAPLLYVDLMGGRKPHLMTAARNNLGAETRVAYAPSTRFYLADKLAGRPWVTRLPFPVQVVERVETIDFIGRNRMVARYAYHHGYYDGFEREFRGFGMVEQFDTEEFRDDTAFADNEFLNWNEQSWSPPMVTRTWFHTGAFIEATAVSRQYESEYWTEPALRAMNRAADSAALRLPDTVVPEGLNAFEIQEAYRALKGHALRVETYAEDKSAVVENPYTVTEQNFSIVCLQHRGANAHAVFLVHPRESISFHYERGAGDPRVGHEFTLQTDAYGNITRSLTVAYSRRAGYPPPEPTLPSMAQAMLAYDQTRLHIGASEHRFTKAIDNFAASPDVYRTPLPAATTAAEITGVAPSIKGNGITNLFTFTEADDLWQTAWTGANDIPYEAIPASDVDGSGTPAGALTRRILSEHRVVYRSDDLAGLLVLGEVEPRGLTGESYTQALTGTQLAEIFDSFVSAATLVEGGYVTLAGETGWWVPSGRVFLSPGDSDTPAQELAVAKAQFFLPRRTVDPFGAITRVDYDGYQLLAVKMTDAVGNVTGASNDYRVLAAAVVTDPNGNRGAVAFDALGAVTATAAMGKTSETLGDLLTGFAVDLDEATLIAHFADPLASPAALLGNATTRTIYDLDAYRRSGGIAPPAVYALARETHVSDLGVGGAPVATQYQISLAYSDGFGREIQRKARATPGPVTEAGPDVATRWIGSGWTLFNNKGRPVRRYEPFFSTTSRFEFAAQTGVSTVVLYDPPGRAVATLLPDNTWEKIVFDAWRSENWDRNDTVAIADPRGDADVGGYFQRCLGTALFVSWHDQRIGGGFGATAQDKAAQRVAAERAAAHAATPSVSHFDGLGRVCLAVSDNGGGARFTGRSARDASGRPLAAFDALGRRAEEYCRRAPQPGGGFRYIAGVDMAGNPLYHVNSDGGARRIFSNVAGQPIRSWDARGHAFRLVYDAAMRPIRRYVATDGAAEILIDLSIYGEGQAAANLCGVLYRHYDSAGYVENSRCDFKGNALSSTRQLAVGYRQTIDWTTLAGQSDGAALDATAQAAGLIPTGDSGRDRFTSFDSYDALDRPIQSVTPHNATMRPSVLRPAYDAAAMLVRIDTWLQQPVAPEALLDPATADRHVVTAIVYNARGQPQSVAHGNGTAGAYDYDPATFRLAHLVTTRPDALPADQRTVQALSYYYDPVGNITGIRDDADTQNVVYFQNQRVEPSSDYTYDPIYRLIAASGREHLGQTGGALQAPQQTSNDDSFRQGLPQPGDGNAMGRYSENYGFDALSNLLIVSHQASSGSWTRRYSYAEASQIVAGEIGNRVSSTSLPGDPSAGPFSATYAHDAHGNMVRMPHLPAMVWDENDRLRLASRQVVNAGTPETSYYVYDAAGGRLRKLIDGQAGQGQSAIRKAERIYLGAIEIYREYGPDGTSVSLERETLHVEVGDRRVALIEARTTGADSAPALRVRYQYANRLGSAVLELGDSADIISYEEYFPFGGTSYQAVASQADTAKRYRFTGKERDGENDLYFHGARYYAPWLGRWTACDPIGIEGGVNLYSYVHGNPIAMSDPSGTQGDEEKPQQELDLLSKLGISTDRGSDSGPSFFDKIGETFAQVGSAIASAASAAWEWVKGAAKTAWNATVSALSKAWEWTKEAASTAWEWTKGAARTAWTATTSALSKAWEWTKGAASAAWEWTKGAARTAWEWTKGAAATAWEWTKNAASAVWEWTKGAAKTAWEWTKKAANWVWNWIFAPLIRTATNAVFGAAVGFLFGGIPGAIAGGAIGAITGAVHGWRMAAAESYDWTSGYSWLAFLLDNTWSLPNSALASLFATINLGNSVDKGLSKHSTRLIMKTGLGSYDQTWGNVTAGTQVPTHEGVHVLQARIFGPLFYPSMAAHYVFNTVLPYWLIYHKYKYPNAKITGFITYFSRGVYPHTWGEEWAYSVEGSPP